MPRRSSAAHRGTARPASRASRSGGDVSSNAAATAGDGVEERDVQRALAMAADGGSDARTRAILWLLARGYSQAGIARVFGLTRQRIHALVAPRVGSGFHQAIDAERQQRARAAAPLLARGLSRSAVATRLGIGEHELHAMIAAARQRLAGGATSGWEQTLVDAIEAGHQRLHQVRERYRAELIDAVGAAIRASGKTLQQIAEESGLSRSSLYELSHNMGRTPWSPSPAYLGQLARAVPAVAHLRVRPRPKP